MCRNIGREAEGKHALSSVISIIWLTIKPILHVQTDNSDDEMIVARILFLTTYDTDLNFKTLVHEHSLGENVHYVGGSVTKETKEEGLKSNCWPANNTPFKANPQKWEEDTSSD